MSRLVLMTLPALAAAACAIEAPTSGETAQPVQSSLEGYWYEVSTRPAGAIGMAQMSEGTVFQSFGSFDYGQVPGYPAVTRPVRATCGLTFVSPSRAITAGHCVDGVPLGAGVPIEMYRLGPEAAGSWPAATQLQGVTTSPRSFPLWTHAPIAGHSVESFTCQLVMRCGAGNGLAGCNLPDGAKLDLAVLSCPDEPGCSFDYASIGESQAVGEEVGLAWAQEVYDVPVDDPGAGGGVAKELFDHYSVITSSALNFHYVGDAGHQLLPLTQTFIAGSGVAPTIQSAEALVTLAPGWTARVVYTNLSGCHGTSGAGVFAHDTQRGIYRLLGPVVTGATNDAAGPGLCQGVTGAVPGQGEAYTTLPALLAAFDDIAGASASCATPTRPGGPLLWSSFDVAQIPEVAAGTVAVDELDQPWPCSGEACSMWERFRFIDEPTLFIPPGGSVTIPGLELLPRTRYRLSVRTHDHYFDGLVPGISARTSPLYVFVNRVPVASSLPRVMEGEHVSLLTTEFTTTAASSLTITNGGIEPQEITDLQLVVHGAPNTLDDRIARASAGLQFAAPTRIPARFVGDPASRFGAILAPGERLYLRREAFTNWPEWSASFRVSGNAAGLVCGLLYRNSSASAVVDCDPQGDTQVEVTFPAKCPSDMLPYIEPALFFIQMPADSSGEVIVDDIALTHTDSWSACQ